MKSLLAFVILLLTFAFTFGQGEQSPIVEKDIAYKTWAYKNIQTGETINLREFTKGKKLVAIVYFAPWCPNWRMDAPMLQRLFDKYRSSGFAIMGVGEYDTVDAMKANIKALNITFPIVYESESRGDKQKTLHYQYRTSTGDARGWGSPWYVLLTPSMMEKKGELLTKRTFVINGQMIEAEGEKFIREKLGLKPMDAKPAISASAMTDKIEVCEPATTAPITGKPVALKPAAAPKP